ncbi:Zinc/iron permease [Glonium stellatum]|uniref:Zinc/iron permease n=1 Tax=Glonium stellatum TaxID=574774 RepID=A0A8E2F513_9PEZI|nr:Zinc/iron permease [Glonium stellatum]
MPAHDSFSLAPGLSWSDIPTHLLHAELHRRQANDGPPPCGSKGAREHYNTPLHVVALIIILLLSTLACSFPIIVRRFPRLPVPHHVLFLSRHFGTGVLIATAFVHLLPTAFQSLTDPCLPYFWSQGYTAMPGLIAMIAVLVVVGIEMFFASRGAGHVHSSDYDVFPADDAHHVGVNNHARPVHKKSNSFGRFRHGKLGVNGHTPDVMLDDIPGSTEHLMDGRSPSVLSHSPLPREESKNATEDEDSDLDLEELDPMDHADESRLLNGITKRRSEHHPRFHPPDRSSSSSPLGSKSNDHLTPQQQKKMLLQCLLLEAGILFHSVFIGMALSVATGTSFIVLLVAISFHQTFEGLALGSRIAALRFAPRSPKPWLMALAYGTTTPVGQAIGLLIHNLYDPASQTGLLTVGVMNAISSGLLLFAGLVELLAEDFLSDESYEALKGRRRVEACGAVVGGAALMALVGAWA